MADAADPAPGAPRCFVPRGAVAGGRLAVDGADAAALLGRGLAVGRRVVALDGSGWAYDVALDAATPERVAGAVVGRWLAPARRTRVSLYYSPLDDAANHALAVRAATAGVVALTPVFSAASRVDVPPPSPAALALPVRAAAEAAGWGRAPVLGEVAFLDAAIDQAARAGAAVLVAMAGGPPASAALGDRPFTVALFCPTAGAFTPDELARAAARGGQAIGWDPAAAPVAAVGGALESVYAALDP